MAHGSGYAVCHTLLHTVSLHYSAKLSATDEHGAAKPRIKHGI